MSENKNNNQFEQDEKKDINKNQAKETFTESVKEPEEQETQKQEMSDVIEQKMEEVQRKRRSEETKSFLSYFVPLFLILTAVLSTVYYIAVAAKGEFHSDCTDTILWANASYESGHIYDETFKYACFLPFGVNIMMKPLIAKFGLSMTAHVAGMMIFFIRLAVAFVLFLRELHWDMRSICYAGFVFLSMTLISKKSRELFWGHAIYYSLGIFFLLVGMCLYCKIWNLIKKRKQLELSEKELQHNSISLIICFVLLCLFMILTSTDGISSLSIFALPFIGTIFAERILDNKSALFSQKNMYFYAAIIILAFMMFFGIKLNGVWTGELNAGYQDAYSVFSPMDEWVEHANSFPVAWLTILGVKDLDGIMLSDREGVKNLLYILNAIILFVFPIMITCFYPKMKKSEKGSIVCTWVWIHWAVTAIILLGFICGVLSGANWRVLPCVMTAVILTILFVYYVFTEKKAVSRITFLMIIPLFIVSFMSCLEVKNMPKDSYKSNYLFGLADYLEEQNLTYG